MDNKIVSYIFEMIGTFIYRMMIKNVRLFNIFHKLRIKLLKYRDPIVSVNIGDTVLSLNLSHNLPLYYTKYDRYDRVIPELCFLLKQKEKFLNIIDIGANIGDTAIFIDKRMSKPIDNIDGYGEILCVEGVKEFIHLLYKNTSQLKIINAHIAETFCSDDSKKASDYEIHISSPGSAQLVKRVNENSCDHTFTTLDELVNAYPIFQCTNILKIDTDGFESSVLRGGKNFLQKNSPAIFFEFTPSGFINSGTITPDDEEIFHILSDLGYEKSLFYDNFGYLCHAVNMCDSDKIKNCIKKIDSRKIYYYDILTVHKNKIVHNELLKTLVKNDGYPEDEYF